MTVTTADAYNPACTCTPPTQIADLIRKSARSTVKSLKLEDAEADSSWVFGSTFRCKGCDAFYVVNIVVTTLPRVQPAQESPRVSPFTTKADW